MQKSRLIAGRKSVIRMLVAFGLVVLVPSLYAQNLSEIVRCFQQTSPEPITHEINEIVQQPCTPRLRASTM